MEEQRFVVRQIGRVRRTGSDVWIEILPPYRSGLKHLDWFSHAIVLWWAHEFDNPGDRAVLQTLPRCAPDRVTGVFACRSPRRPNPILLTTCEVLDVDEDAGQVCIRDIDAHDGSPVVDIKPYFPVSERVPVARIPEWLSDWPQWFPDEGIGLREDTEPEAGSNLSETR